MTIVNSSSQKNQQVDESMPPSFLRGEQQYSPAGFNSSLVTLGEAAIIKLDQQNCMVHCIVCTLVQDKYKIVQDISKIVRFVLLASTNTTIFFMFYVVNQGHFDPGKEL